MTTLMTLAEYLLYARCASHIFIKHLYLISTTTLGIRHCFTSILQRKNNEDQGD